MKRLFYLFIFLSVTISSYAQVNLDSLWNVWNDKTQADTIRLEAVYYFIQGGINREFDLNPFFIQNTDSLLALIKLVDEVTEASGNRKYEMYAERLKGLYHQTGQNLPEAVKLYAQALEMAKAMKDKRLILMSTVTLANGEKYWGVANGRPDSARLAQAEKRYLEAINLFELESFKSDGAESKPDPQLSNYAFVAQYNMGHLYLILNNFPDGIQYLERSLETAERSGNCTYECNALSLLGTVQVIQKNYPNARQYFEEAIVLAGKAGDAHLLKELMGKLGGVLEAERNYPAAISYFTKSLKIAEEKGDNYWIAHNLMSLGGLYNEVKEFSKAEDYLTRSLASMNAAGPHYRIEQTNAYIGLHNCYIKQKRYAKAISNDSIFLKLAGEINISAVPIGLVMLTEDYQNFGDYAKALQYGFKALKAIDEMPPNQQTAYMRNHVSVNIGNAYRKQNQFSKAITWCEKAITDQDVELQKGACECLYESHKALKHGNEALAYHEKFLLLSDSLNTEELGKSLQQMEFGKQMLADSLLQEEEKLKVEMAHKEESHKKDNTRNALMGSGLLVLLLAGGLWSRLRFTRKSKATLQVEKDRSENLLLNILPAEIAEELKMNGEALARDFDMVSIIFTDFKGFTESSEKVSAAELVGELNHCFKGFDAIMEKHGIEKIKTIGDAYMAAGGLPVATDDSIQNTVKAALEMQQFMTARKVEQDARGLLAFEMRAGIHTGPVVAGIVGVKKFQYDIWGDTVNTAARMESSGEVGQVNISQDTYEHIKNESTFSFKNRGKIQAKGKGEMEMYFVT